MGKGAQPSGCALVSSEYRLFSSLRQLQVGERCHRIEGPRSGGGRGVIKAMEADDAIAEIQNV
jgi:hypothetical protein